MQGRGMAGCMPGWMDAWDVPSNNGMWQDRLTPGAISIAGEIAKYDKIIA